MTDDSYSFATARTRLEEIVSQVRKKDTSLEKSLDLLEEGVRLANQCTELIDHADWEAAGAGTAELDAEAARDASEGDEVRPESDFVRGEESDADSAAPDDAVDEAEQG